MEEGFDAPNCPICTDTVSIPVVLKLLNCGCKNKQRYCLTCVRDALNMNGYKNGAKDYSIKSCPTCRAELNFPNGKNLKSFDVYEIDNELMSNLDKTLGKTGCPRGCEWTGSRKEIQPHLKECDNTFHLKCVGCPTLFTKKGLQEHIQTGFCRKYYMHCLQCEKRFFDEKDAASHVDTCPYKGKKKCKQCDNLVSEDPIELLDHLLKCMYI